MRGRAWNSLRSVQEELNKLYPTSASRIYPQLNGLSRHSWFPALSRHDSVLFGRRDRRRFRKTIQQWSSQDIDNDNDHDIAHDHDHDHADQAARKCPHAYVPTASATPRRQCHDARAAQVAFDSQERECHHASLRQAECTASSSNARCCQTAQR